MERTKALPDLTINGVGQASGGSYGEVRIDGVSRLKGDIECEKLHINGVVSTHGTLKAKEMAFDGKLNAGELLDAGNARMNGMVKVKGRFRGEAIELNGFIDVGGDLSAERLVCRGALDVKGLLNAGEVDITAEGRCKAREIGGETIRTRRRKSGAWRAMWGWAIPKLIAVTEAETIEGDRIELEYTTATAVRGSVVHIGKGCRIGSVEYTGQLVVHPEAKVEHQARI
ncbi:hypothetical protein [Cohnella fermenti]|uniref:Polymer-forming cytoskeletal protein n=1 Tax=Cohnella fermenti TaxID=2565925 RepID=A0A4S4C4E0_9BACL|nr:hypothetical protein [Cohnella fermenti]THF82667.1 hypothetical protein E6C55_06255 [Cohnella fermenti]